MQPQADHNAIPFPEYPGPLMKPSTWRALQRYAESRDTIRRIKAADGGGLDVTQVSPGFYTIDTKDGA